MKSSYVFPGATVFNTKMDGARVNGSSEAWDSELASNSFLIKAKVACSYVGNDSVLCNASVDHSKVGSHSTILNAEVRHSELGNGVYVVGATLKNVRVANGITVDKPGTIEDQKIGDQRYSILDSIDTKVEYKDGTPWKLKPAAFPDPDLRDLTIVKVYADKKEEKAARKDPTLGRTRFMICPHSIPQAEAAVGGPVAAR